MTMSMAEKGARPAQLSKIRAFCAARGSAIAFDEQSATLMDLYSGKKLALDAPNLVNVEEQLDKETAQPYLRLTYGNARQLALAGGGIAFAPDFRNTGPLAELPQAVCFRDFHTLLEQFKHQVYGHGERPPTREALRLLMMCIAIVDGGRAQGFDVAREEKELEWQLSELEKRR
jgi:hypothetical protein